MIDRYLTMEDATIYLPMLDGETKENAEDRLIAALDAVGGHLIGWGRSTVEEEVTGDA